VQCTFHACRVKQSKTTPHILDTICSGNAAAARGPAVGAGRPLCLTPTIIITTSVLLGPQQQQQQKMLGPQQEQQQKKMLGP
jgi:hypothetical protein